MKKIVRFLFLVIITFIFAISVINIAKAQRFYIKVADTNKDGKISLKAFFQNWENITYYTGIASLNHEKISFPITLPANANFPLSNSFNVTQGSSFIFDVYLTPNLDDIQTYYWTSHGDASGSSTGASISIDWFKGNSKIAVFNFNYSSSGDKLEVVPVPIPPALYLLGSGIVALGLTRKKLLSN